MFLGQCVLIILDSYGPILVCLCLVFIFFLCFLHIRCFGHFPLSLSGLTDIIISAIFVLMSGLTHGFDCTFTNFILFVWKLRISFYRIHVSPSTRVGARVTVSPPSFFISPTLGTDDVSFATSVDVSGCLDRLMR